MGFFRKRSGAILVFLAVVILASFFAARRSLGGRVQEINDLFSDGIYDTDQRYRLPSINRQLKERGELSNNLLSIALYHPEAEAEAAALRSARNALVNGLDDSAGASRLYGLNKELDTAFKTLYSRLQTLKLAENDKDYADKLYGEWENTAALIQRSRYNETVRQFNREVLSVFPTNFVMKLTFVNPPELFE